MTYLAKLPERFVKKIEVDPATDCWEWRACTNASGYGRFLLAGVNRLAHRVAYELSVGPIPDGLQIDHLCRNRLCVNPAHMEPVTLRENIRRGGARFSARKWAATRTHCRNGHPISTAGVLNMVKRGAPMRYCRTCFRAARARYLQKRKAGLAK